ncbi:MAG: hypothetical protein CL611_02710 [Anaerolineaceae bacterium]|nr:hypothetical protein [Anaerolineaceae bacterium]|tara:strand:+ start:633 stop:2303 length:1671 start_codon:yes stop_codon:yes gene_type:complete
MRYAEEGLHPMVQKARESLYEGRVSRREFIRLACLLGTSYGAARFLAACGAPTATTGGGAAAEEIVRGGTLRCASQVPAVDHPMRFSWIYDANVFRHIFEYLNWYDEQGVTHPYLLESYVPNDDLTVWTLNLKQNVTWSNGDALEAEHVKWSIGQWLDPDVGSSTLGLWEGFLTSDGVEVVDAHTIKMNMDAPILAVAEQLTHYAAPILHPTFDGDCTSGNNPGTGYMTLDEYIEGEKARIVKRDDYWDMGADGKPLPYLDAMEWYSHGDDQAAGVAMLKSGQVESIYDVNIDNFLAIKDDANLRVIKTPTSSTRVGRFRVDLDPWTDNRVRMAVKKCQDRQKILDNSYFGQGDIGFDTHAAPSHPEFAPMDDIPYDPEGAKALLEEAGMSDLSFDIAVGTGWSDIVAFAETLQEDAKAAGISVTLDTMPNSAYWDVWTEAAVGITTWANRPLAVMVLPLAYIADSEGNPVPWNESRWVDDEFSALLKTAQGTFDLEARRAIMKDIQRIQSERGSVFIPFFKPVFRAYTNNVRGASGHPQNYNTEWREAWIEPSSE